MNRSDVTTEGLRGAVPGSKATRGANVPPGGGAPSRRRKRPEPEYRSYYDLPVINKPVWEAPDIPGYLFFGGLAGASAVIAAAGQATGRRRLARVSKAAAAVGGHLSLVALVHDLGRPARFLNMLRVLKVTSPMSVGSWLLAGFVPAATAAAVTDLTGLLPRTGAAATASAAVLGPPVAAYTAALISNTAVPAWHDGYEVMPFVFVSSGLAAAAGLALAAAPADGAAPVRRLAVCAGLTETALTKVMEHRTGMVKEAYETGKAKKYLRAAEVLTTGGVLLAAVAGRRRAAAAVAGAALFAGSAFTRFGIFEAGLISSEDPKYTVVPQREKLEADR